MYNVKKIRSVTMLKPLRNKKVMATVMWGLVIIFAAWGIGSIAVGQKLYAGILFNKKVPVQEYNRSYQAVLNKAKMAYGEELPKMEKFLNLKAQAWDRLILLKGALNKNLRATNKEVISRIASFPFFQRNGVFDEGLYSYIVTSLLGTAPRDFEETIRGDIMIEKLINTITEGITITDDQAKKAFADENESAGISFITIKAEDYKNSAAAEENEIRAFYDENRQRFLDTGYINARYIKLPFYENKEDAEYSANELLSQAKNSKGLSAVAKEYELEIEETGDISLNADISTLGLPYSLVLSAYGLEQGQISDVIESDDAFYIIELKSKTQPKPRPYDQVRERAKDMLLAEKSFSLARDKAEEIMEMLSSPNADFNSIVKNLGYEIIKESNVSRKSTLEALGKARDFADNVFTSGVNKITGPVRTPSGWAIIRLDSITPFDEEKYLKEKSEFTAGLLEKKRTDAFNSWFADFKKKAGLKENI